MAQGVGTAPFFLLLLLPSPLPEQTSFLVYKRAVYKEHATFGAELARSGAALDTPEAKLAQRVIRCPGNRRGITKHRDISASPRLTSTARDTADKSRCKNHDWRRPQAEIGGTIDWDSGSKNDSTLPDGGTSRKSPRPRAGYEEENKEAHMSERVLACHERLSATRPALSCFARAIKAAYAPVLADNHAGEQPRHVS
ncbi:hypothetical protein KM043_009864 [Ampulex compressa]|nr:hypothetical protein KM043_009864 [Ampulex compressa]